MTLEGRIWTPDDMQELGVSKTVYSLVYPETREVLKEILKEPGILDMYKGAYTKRQDSMHAPFIEGYREWAQPVVDISAEEFPHAYPTSGSSEAIRECIASLGSNNEDPTLHVFTGEYEGYRAYAGAHGVTVRTHSRDDYQASLKGEVKPGDQFYISQPSGIDGNVWEGFQDFVGFFEEEIPEGRMYVDLAYLGTVARPFTAHVNSPAVEGVFFSLSKSFGTYYHRIGGMFSRSQMPGLYGNMWFKNLLSMKFGEELMKRFGVHELPQKYLEAQRSACTDLEKAIGREVSPGDVILTATTEIPEAPTPLDELLTRSDRVRFCLTQAIDQALTT